MPKARPKSTDGTKILGLKDLTREIQRCAGIRRSPRFSQEWPQREQWTEPGDRRRLWRAAASGLHAATTLVIVLAHVGDVDDFRDDVATFAGIVPEVFPAWESCRAS